MSYFSKGTILNDLFHFLLGAAGHYNISILYGALFYQLVDFDDNSVLNISEVLLGYWKGELILKHFSNA